jgi:hypothetical protein
MLFEAGYNPNRYYDVPKSTPWLFLLEFLNASVKDSERRLDFIHGIDLLWVDVCKLFLLWGADINICIKCKRGTRSMWEVLRAAYRHLPPESVLELKRLIDQRKAESVRQNARTRNQEPSLSDTIWP